MTTGDIHDGTTLNAHDYKKVRSYLIAQVQPELESISKLPPNQHQATLLKYIVETYEHAKLKLSDETRERIFKDIQDEILGFGPIQPLLDDPEITEVMVNGPRSVYIEKKGNLSLTDVTFDDDAHIMRMIEKIISPLGRHVEEDSPMVDARLPDGSRVNAIIPPVAIDGPSITIRKFSKDKLPMKQLIEYGSITEDMAEFLRACVISRLNILISGGTGSGKTTLLNVLSSYIPEKERIVTIEDAAELRLQQDHIVRLETKAANVEARGQVTIRDLVRNSLRMRPDRIVVGEVRGGEALDMLQAMNTGHDGSLTTIHANSPRDAMSRLETLVLMAGMDLPIKIVRQQISSAIDVIIQQSRMRDGSRKVIAISEVAGMEGDVVVLTDIFKYEQTGQDVDGKVMGEMKPTGLRPFFTQRLEESGFKLAASIFGASMSEILMSNQRRHR
ncbi:MAG TPA: CpaF family protein [Anaerolineales bacterium]|nr:CpaF family protein [Anaerolineales bacterium]